MKTIYEPVRVIALQSCEIYPSMRAAADSVPGARVECISRACARKRNFAGGLCWRYAADMLGRAAREGKTLRQVCDEELARIAVRTVYGGAKYYDSP